MNKTRQPYERYSMAIGNKSRLQKYGMSVQCS